MAILGGPKSGKTTLALALKSPRVRATDELIPLGWSEASEAASAWFDEPGEWVLEGLAMVRAMRKWLDANETGLPAELIVWVNTPVAIRSRGQHIAALGADTIWIEVKPRLEARGARILELGSDEAMSSLRNAVRERGATLS